MATKRLRRIRAREANRGRATDRAARDLSGRPGTEPRWLREAVEESWPSRLPRRVLVIDGRQPAAGASLIKRRREDESGAYRRQASADAHAGAARARGDYIRFVDCDDFYRPTHRALLRERGSETSSPIAPPECDEQLRPVWKMCRASRGTSRTSLLGRFTSGPRMLFPRRVSGDREFDPYSRHGGLGDVLRASEHARARGDTNVANYYRPR